jgi:hypothetical protein
VGLLLYSLIFLKTTINSVNYCSNSKQETNKVKHIIGEPLQLSGKFRGENGKDPGLASQPNPGKLFLVIQFR